MARLDAYRLRSERDARLAAGDTTTEARDWAREVAAMTADYRDRCYAAFRIATR